MGEIDRQRVAAQLTRRSDEKQWPIKEAAQAGDLAALQSSLSEETLSAPCDSWDSSPLHVACKGGHLACAKVEPVNTLLIVLTSVGSG